MRPHAASSVAVVVLLVALGSVYAFFASLPRLVCLFVYLFICLFVYLFICLFVYGYISIPEALCPASGVYGLSCLHSKQVTLSEGMFRLLLYSIFFFSLWL